MSSDVDGVFDTTYNSRAVSQDRGNTSRNIGAPKEPRVSVTVVLRRLVDYGEVYDNVDERNVRTWLWIGPLMQGEVIDDHPFSR